MIRLYDRDTLFEEVAFVAYHFGWSHDEVLELPHWERRRWCGQISDINERMNGDEAPSRPDQQSTGFLDSNDGGTVIQNSLEDL